MSHLTGYKSSNYLTKIPRLCAGVVLFTVTIATGFSNSACAQSIDYGNLEKLFGEPVTKSATGSPQRATDVPANMDIITADEIRRSGANSIPDILQFVAGVDIRRYGAAQAEVSIRGYNQQFSSRLLVLVNGRQVYLDDYGHTAWQSLPVQIDEIRQIEVVRGPNSALYGFNALAGVINIVTYDPKMDDANSITARTGTQGYTSGSAVVTLHAGDKAGLRLSAGGFDMHEFSTRDLPAALGPYNQSPRQFSLSTDGRLELAPNMELTAEATAVNARQFEALPLPNYNDNTYQTTSLKLGLTADLNLGLFNISAYRNDFKFVFRSPGSVGTELNQVYVVQANDVIKLGADHTVRFGLEYRNNAVSGGIFGGRIEYDVYAASTMWSWQITPELTLTNALRLDHLALSYTGSLVPGIRYSLADLSDGQLSELSYNSGIVFKPAEDKTFRILLARGIQAPSLVDFGLQTTNIIGGVPVSFVGNPALRAASVTNYEFDYDQSIAPFNMTLRAAVYFQRTDNLLSSALNAPLAPGAGGLVSYSQNIGSSSAVGSEIGLKGVSSAGIRWNFNYSLISIEDRLSLGSLNGYSSVLNYEDGSPVSAVRGGIGFNWHRFEVDASARWQSQFTDYRPTVGNGAEPVGIGNYITVNARVGYQVTETVKLGVAGDQIMQSRILSAAGVAMERRITASVTAAF